jgi:hypothetical protein
MVPVLEENVPAGVHYVKVEGGKGERFGQTIDVKGALVKVRASFSSGGGERTVVSGPVDPKISQIIDDATAQRLAGYLKATPADYALVGYVYKTGDTTLTAGSALYSVKKNAFAALEPVAFDTDVLTANTEAFKLADQVVLKLSNFGASASLPLNLASKPPKAGTSGVAIATGPAKVDVEDIEASTPKERKVVLTPTERKFEDPSTMVELDANEHLGEKPPEVTKGGVPAWVWVVTGVAVAAGAGVGGYFAYTAATKPVTGTVTASW